METFKEHIDPHVHCRGWKESYKATIKSVTDLARRQRVGVIFDMPNTDPPIISRELVKKRIETARTEGCLDGYYLYIGVTSNPDQIREAVEVVSENPRVVGIKMFTCKSVGNLSILEEKAQMKVYEELAQAGYGGVLAVHCEKESLFRMDLWDFKHPQSWNLARPPRAEIESVKDQIRFAREQNFKGTLHICHVSTPRTVQIIREEKGLHITCGVTPHHLTYSTNDMQKRLGLLYKVNPPIREPSSVKLLRDNLIHERIDWIETDHAPHTQREKLYPPNLSGIESLREYSCFINSLVADGVTEEQIMKLTVHNIKRVFKKVNP